MRRLTVILSAALSSVMLTLPALAASDQANNNATTNMSQMPMGDAKAQPDGTPQKNMPMSSAAMPGMAMSGMGGQGMTMHSSIDLTDPMNRESSGTAWVPDSTPIYAKMKMRGKDMLMLHGGVWPRYTALRSGRAVSASGEGGSSRFDAPSWFMGMYSHPLDAGPQPMSQLGFRLMMSADPLIERGYGYPLLYQSGESYHGVALHDRQHPHDLFDELSATYSRRVGHHNSAYLYIGYPGEPALGPPTFMHRLSAMDMPDAPIEHHWEDSTHITFGVATLGYSMGKVKIEGSAFNGSEPDENRYDFDRPRLNSYSGRLSWNPSSNLALQASYGFVKGPEALEPDTNIHRTTASVIYNRPLGDDANWSNSLVWGQNNTSGEGKANAYLFESNYQKGANTVYGRLERVQKSGHELVLAPADLNNVYGVAEYSVGYVRDLKHGSGLDVGLGVQATLYTNPSSLDPYYGSQRHGGFEIFFRLRPSRLKDMSSMANMDMAQAAKSGDETANKLNVTATLNPDPPTAEGPNMLTVTLTDAAGQPVTGARIESGVAMTSMDMGTKHPAFKELGAGRYQGSVTFSMSGSWRVTLQITPPSGKVETHSLDFKVP